MVVVVWTQYVPADGASLTAEYSLSVWGRQFGSKKEDVKRWNWVRWTVVDDVNSESRYLLEMVLVLVILRDDDAGCTTGEESEMPIPDQVNEGLHALCDS